MSNIRYQTISLYIELLIQIFQAGQVILSKTLKVVCQPSKIPTVSVVDFIIPKRILIKLSFTKMDSDSAELVNEIKSKVILHWSCRSLVEFPEAIRTHGLHIQEIYLKWNKLTTLPPWIVELFNITNLYIHSNLIKELPPEVCQMSRLTVLDLSANKLKSIPSSVGNLVNLKSLLLDDNSIEKLPPEGSCLLSLEIFSIAGNKLVALPEWIGSLPKLKELNADHNNIKELPNRLTLSPEISVVSVRSNRLRYLPLNGFASSALCLKFNGNIDLNYISYPLLCQLISKIPNALGNDQRNSLGDGCFKVHCENNVLHTNIKLNIKISASHEDRSGFTIELPRQISKVYNVHENTPVSLWESALRKVYTNRCNHTLDISTSPVNINVQYEPISTNGKPDLTMYPINYASYNLLMNGPASICVNSNCQQPIFTEAWIIVGISRHAESVITVALCCCKRCASEFTTHSNTIDSLIWQYVN